MTAQEAREISKVNDLSYVYSLITQAAHKGEYMVSVDDLSEENRIALVQQGYKVRIIDICGARSYRRYFEISWRDKE